jgi:hypothetical protein
MKEKIVERLLTIVFKSEKKRIDHCTVNGSNKKVLVMTTG